MARPAPAKAGGLGGEIAIGTASDRWRALLAAWVAVLLASDVAAIVSELYGHELPTWNALARAAVIVGLAVSIPRAARPPHARGFMLALAAMTVGGWIVSVIQGQVHWFAVAPRAQGMLARVFVNLVPAALMVLTLVGSGLSRRDLFLARGDPRAPTSFPLVRGAPWNVVGPVLLAIISVVLVVQLAMVSHAAQHFRPAVLVWGLPAALIFAAVNASWEEFSFRCVLLARGVRAFGPGQAVAASSLLFGLAHYGGHPSGLSGVAMATFFAWIVARSMLDTRGWTWAWLLHVVQDVIIFLMVLLTGV